MQIRQNALRNKGIVVGNGVSLKHHTERQREREITVILVKRKTQNTEETFITANVKLS